MNALQVIHFKLVISNLKLTEILTTLMLEREPVFSEAKLFPFIFKFPIIRVFLRALLGTFFRLLLLRSNEVRFKSEKIIYFVNNKTQNRTENHLNGN